MSTNTQPLPEGYKQDAHGRLVPVALIKPVDLARDSLVAEIVDRAKTTNRILRELRERTNADIQAFAELSAETYGAKVGGKKGNLTLVSFDGRFKVQRAMADVLVFDERLQAAKILVDACITEWSDGTRPEVRALINGAFQVDKEGMINTGRVLTLRQLDIKEPRWLKAMEAINDSLRVAVTRSYLRIYERVGDTDEYTPINLDLANA